MRNGMDKPTWKPCYAIATCGRPSSRSARSPAPTHATIRWPRTGLQREPRLPFGMVVEDGPIVNALGCRVAEELLLGTITTGAENDIKQATDLARAMVTRFGMSQEVGLLSLSGAEEGNFLE